MLRGTLCAPGPRDPAETKPELCLSVSCGGTGQQWPASGALGTADLGHTACGISLLGGGCHKPHHRATRTYTGLGKQTLGGYKQKLMHTRTQEKGAVIPQETDPDLPVSVQESLAEAWVGGAG